MLIVQCRPTRTDNTTSKKPFPFNPHVLMWRLAPSAHCRHQNAANTVCSSTSSAKLPNLLSTYEENFRVTLAMTESLVSGASRQWWSADVLCKATTLNMKPRESTRTTTGSTLRPGDSSVYSPIVDDQPTPSSIHVHSLYDEIKRSVPVTTNKESFWVS